MTLADLKKVAIRKQTRIRFDVPGGLQCVVTEHGIAQVPGLSRVPDFSLDDIAQNSASFTLEPLRGTPERATPSQLAAMVGNAGQPHPEDHDD